MVLRLPSRVRSPGVIETYLPPGLHLEMRGTAGQVVVVNTATGEEVQLPAPQEPREGFFLAGPDRFAPPVAVLRGMDSGTLYGLLLEHGRTPHLDPATLADVEDIVADRLAFDEPPPPARFTVGETVTVPRDPPARETIADVRLDPTSGDFWQYSTTANTALFWQESLLSRASITSEGASRPETGRVEVPAQNIGADLAQVAALVEDSITGGILGLSELVNIPIGELVVIDVDIPAVDRDIVVKLKDIWHTYEWLDHALPFVP